MIETLIYIVGFITAITSLTMYNNRNALILYMLGIIMMMIGMMIW